MKPREERADGRRSLLVYLDPDLIRTLKKAALDREVHAYLLVEEAVAKYLEHTPAAKPSDL